MSERVTSRGRVVADGVNVKQAALLYCRLVFANEPAQWVSDVGELVAEFKPDPPVREAAAKFSTACYYYALGQVEAFGGLHFLDGTDSALMFAQLPHSSPTFASWTAFESEVRRRMAEDEIADALE